MKCPSCKYEYEPPTEQLVPKLFSKGPRKGQPTGAYKWVTTSTSEGPPFPSFSIITGVKHSCRYSNYYDDPQPIRTTLDLNFDSLDAFSCPECGTIFRDLSAEE